MFFLSDIINVCEEDSFDVPATDDQPNDADIKKEKESDAFSPIIECSKIEILKHSNIHAEQLYVQFMEIYVSTAQLDARRYERKIRARLA